jgi:hypothetical protein
MGQRSFGMPGVFIPGIKAKNVVLLAVVCEFGANWGLRLKD